MTLHLPVEVADYVDFYSSEHHAMNVGAIFRPDSPALPPNWKHLPIGYHGRAGTAGGQRHGRRTSVRPAQAARTPTEPTFGPSRRLDIEAEVAFVVGVPSTMGEPVPASAFRDHVFGVALLNDWSARDIQAWEYQPLGPFLGKSFATSLSAWIVPARGAGGSPDPVAPPGSSGAALPRRRRPVDPRPRARGTPERRGRVSRPPFATMYWSPGQQLAHLTVNGASLRTGDVYASGTVSGPERRASAGRSSSCRGAGASRCVSRPDVR